MKTKTARRTRIKRGIRAKLRGSAERPRLSVFRSNQQIYAQLIDDESGKTIMSVSSLTKGDSAKKNKTEMAHEIGKAMAEKALGGGIASVVFDRNGYLYHGRVKSFAEGAREGGLKF